MRRAKKVAKKTLATAQAERDGVRLRRFSASKPRKQYGDAYDGRDRESVARVRDRLSHYGANRPVPHIGQETTPKN
jgi:hypothetical protein